MIAGLTPPSQTQKRYRSENQLSPSIARTKRVVEPTGNLINDAASSAAIGLMSNGSNPIATMGNSMIQTCAPYAINKVKERPISSLFLALGGFYGATKFFNTCSTTTETTKGGNTKQIKTCKKASALQKTGTAAVSILLGNYLLDAIAGSLDTVMTRVKPVSDTGNTLNYDEISNNLDLSFLKAN